MTERRVGYEAMQKQIEQIKKNLQANTKMTQDVSDRLELLTDNVNVLQTSTASVISAFSAAEGAFKALEFFGKLAKPILWISVAATFTLAAWQGIKAFIRTL